MSLYKYVTADRTDVLERGLIRFTQPSAFNDPFEMAPFFASLASDKETDEALDSLFSAGQDVYLFFINEILSDDQINMLVQDHQEDLRKPEIMKRSLAKIRQVDPCRQ